MTAWQISVFSVILMLTACLAVVVGLYAWRRRGTLGGHLLALLMLAVAEWALASAIEASVVDTSNKVFWAQVSYLGIHSIPPLFLILTFQYTQKENWLKPSRILLLWLIPLIIIGLAFTNSFHNLIWTDISTNPNNPNSLSYQYGAGFWVGAFYDYVLILIASWNMVWAAQQLSNIYRRQVGAIVIAAALPWIGNLLYITNINPFPGQGLTSITFLLMGIFLAWSMFRHQLFDFTPIAREKIVDKLYEAVIFIDHSLIIRDLNPAAQELLGIEESIIGQPAQQALAKWPYLENRFRKNSDNPTETKIISDKNGNWYDLRISPLKYQDRTNGYLVILRDITPQRELESALRASEELYRNVTEKANDGIAIVQNERIIYSNPQLAAMLGYSLEDLIDKSFHNFLAAEHVEIIRERHKRRMKGETEPNRYETLAQHKSGHQVPVEFNVSIMEHAKEPALLAIVRDITEQHKAEKDLLEYVRQQKLLNEITLAAIETSSIEDTLKLLADRLGELINADGCYITLWDQKENKAIPVSASGDLSDQYKTLEIKPDENTVTKAVLEKGKPIVIEDVFNTPYIPVERATKFPAQCMLAVPLIADGQKLGAALISFNNAHTFTQKEIALGEQASHQISLAILKAHLLETAQLRAREAETLRQAGTVVSANLKLNEAIDSILEQLNQVVPYDSASVQLLQNDRLKIVGQHGFKDPAQVLGMTFQLSKDNPNRNVIESRQTYIIPDAPQAYQAFKDPPHDHIRGWMGVPLLIQDRIIGMIALDSREVGRFNSEHARLASSFAAQVAIALENANLYEETHRLAIMDSLTGIFNRRHFMTLAQREHQRSCRYNRPLSLIMMDLDHFKRVNDDFGHLIGDQVLFEVAQLCQNNLRESDLIGRYGGEEFAIMLPETPCLVDDDTLSAKSVAERLCNLVGDAKIPSKHGDISITASFGIVGLSKEMEKIETLFDRADTALYIAKQRGRNQVAVWTDTKSN